MFKERALPEKAMQQRNSVMAGEEEHPTSEFDRGMVYHQGLPVAICPVTAKEGNHLALLGGPLRFEGNPRVTIDLLGPGTEPGSAARVSGVIEEPGPGPLRIRLDAKVEGKETHPLPRNARLEEGGRGDPEA